MSDDPQKVSVLFVCLGNICRSPTAEAVFRAKVDEAGLSDRVEIDSAGTGAWHVGAAPDERAQAAARRRGFDLSPLRGRQVARADLDRFDYVLAMDARNLSDLERMAPGRAERFLAYAGDAEIEDVPDPYAGGPEGFEHVLDLVESAADGLLADVRRRLA